MLFSNVVMHRRRSCSIETCCPQREPLMLYAWRWKHHCQPHHLSSCIYYFFPWCNRLEPLICCGRRAWISSSFRLNKTLLSCVFLLDNNSIYKCCWRMCMGCFRDGAELQKHELLLLFISPWLFLQPLLCLLLTSLNQLQAAQTSAVRFVNKTASRCLPSAAFLMIFKICSHFCGGSILLQFVYIWLL